MFPHGWTNLHTIILLSGLASISLAIVYLISRRRLNDPVAEEAKLDESALRRINELIGKMSEPTTPSGGQMDGRRQDPGHRAAFLAELGGNSTQSYPEPRAVPTLISVPTLDSQSDEDAIQAGDSLGRRHAAIWQMADEGLSAEEIASAAGQPVGEIDLILALRRRVRTSPSESPRDEKS